MADPKATPISALPRGPGAQGQGEDDQQFINNILKQMKDDSQESEQAYQQSQQAYQNQQFGVNPAEQHQMNQQQMKQMQQAQYDQMDDDAYEQAYAYPEEVPLTLLEKVKRDIKAPLLFLVLYFALCAPAVRTMAVNQVARFTQNGNIQVYGTTLLLGLVGAVIFFLVNKFVMKF